MASARFPWSSLTRLADDFLATVIRGGGKSRSPHAPTFQHPRTTEPTAPASGTFYAQSFAPQRNIDAVRRNPAATDHIPTHPDSTDRAPTHPARANLAGRAHPVRPEPLRPASLRPESLRPESLRPASLGPDPRCSVAPHPPRATPRAPRPVADAPGRSRRLPRDRAVAPRRVAAPPVIRRVSLPRWQRVARRWPLLQPMAIASGLLVLGAWDWKLAPAIAAGSGVVWLLYRLQPGDWRALDRALRDRAQTLFKGDNGKLAIAVAGGSTALLGTYLTTALLTEVHGGWLSSAVVLQGMGTLAAVGLLLWQWFTGDRDRHDHEFAACLADFTHPEPLRQVIALRQAARLLDHHQLDPQQQAALLDCLRVLRDRDLAPPVEVAFLDTVASLRAQRRSTRPGSRARRSSDYPSYPLADPSPRSAPNPSGFGAPEHPETPPPGALGPATAPTVAPATTPSPATPQPLNLPPRSTP